MFSLNQEKTDTQENLAEQQHALETSIAKWFVSDYENVEEIEFTGWGYSPETGSWGTIVIINKNNRISLSAESLTDIEKIDGLTYHPEEFKLEKNPEIENLPPIRYRVEDIEKISLEGITITYSKDYKGN
ncbi:hypothetical protein [Streptococcus sp. CSL10205-OR2]|uniref:hypothetical protein n=1 Tax=Streptococcus sp. CSL10205-OR2 TaxID=2980558 RepID=UPI0021DA4971|nr:hypothetical protein [Streptococcus sp. CSL10205-OR2]MCU9533536.1 hypothetical protein [Streptococcus sp. CSL10205-OR2]